MKLNSSQKYLAGTVLIEKIPEVSLRYCFN
jgi:hypothetical protein